MESIVVHCDLDGGLEARRPADPSSGWLLVTSGFWSVTSYHSGHIAYYLASAGSGSWVLDGVERNAELDDVTDEDVEAGRLNDDQRQALWGTTLQEAQQSEYKQIVACCDHAAPDADMADIARVLYQAVCEGGGKIVDTPDSEDCLL
jgi:hypothetical protein